MPFVTQPKTVLKETVPRLKACSIPFSRTWGESTVHVLEQPPSKIGVAFRIKNKIRVGKLGKRTLGLLRFRLEVPWQYFMVRMNRMGAILDTFLWFSSGQIADPKNGTVSMPPLPNIYPSGHICNGTIRVNFEDPPHVKVQKAFEAFWTTPFTEETWPENVGLVPECWKWDDHYSIEYGFLRYVFRYWEEHDWDHRKKKWKSLHGECSEWIWKPFFVLNRYHPMFKEFVLTLDQAMDYALQFVPMPKLE